MNSYLRGLLCFGTLALTMFFPCSGQAAAVKKQNQKAKQLLRKAHAHRANLQKDSCSSSSSSSSSSSCSSSTESPCDAQRRPHASRIKAPPYITSKNGQPVMNIVVINRSEAVSPLLLEKVLCAVKTQVEQDFAPFYGIQVKFRVVSNQNLVDWTRNVPLIIDDFLPESAGCGFISFHALESDSDNGFPISEAVFNPPAIPQGTPYIVVPIGDNSTCYGITPVFDEDIPFFPETFDGFFCQVVSHEVLETLHNYTTNLATLDFSENFFGPSTIAAFFNEVCDPVSYNKGYKIDGLNVANFVLPSYWVNDLEQGPFDFLDTVQEPFTPYGGEQDLLVIEPCGTFDVFVISPPPCVADPEDLFIDGEPIFECLDGLTAQADKKSVVQYLKGKKKSNLVTMTGNKSGTVVKRPGFRPFRSSFLSLQTKKAA